MKILKNRKGAAIDNLYQFALSIVLVSLIVGVGVIVLDNFANTDGLSAYAKLAVTNGTVAVGGIATNWISLVVTIGVLAVIMGLVIGAFAMKQGQ